MLILQHAAGDLITKLTKQLFQCRCILMLHGYSSAPGDVFKKLKQGAIIICHCYKVCTCCSSRCARQQIFQHIIMQHAKFKCLFCIPVGFWVTVQIVVGLGYANLQQCGNYTGMVTLAYSSDLVFLNRPQRLTRPTLHTPPGMLQNTRLMLEL